MKASKAKIWAALTLVYLAWGSTYLAIRFTLQTMPPFLMAGTRFLIAGTLLVVWRRLAGDPAPRRIEWRTAAILGVMLLTVGNGGVSWAEQTVPSNVTALVLGSAPLWMTLIDALRPGGSRPGKLSALGVLIGFGGLLLLISPGDADRQMPLDLFAIGILVVTGWSWVVGSLYSRRAPLPESALMGTGMEMLFGGAGLIVLGLLTGEPARLNLAEVSTVSWFSLIYLIFVGAMMAYSAYTWLLRVAPTPLVATYAYVNPVVALALGSLLGGETLTPRMTLAAAIVVGAVVLITSGQKDARTA